MKKNVSIGIDFGTLSARGIVYDLNDGSILFSYTSEYTHKTIEDKIPNTNIHLPNDWALQDPSDYIKSLYEVLMALGTYVNKDISIKSIGTTFTASTVMPLDENNNPLMFNDKYKERIHAWPKLWKHHSAQNYADRINALAVEANQNWIKNYGGKISSEWLFPKALQILEEDQEIYDKMSTFVEAGDWIVYLMTTNLKRSVTQAGFKGLYADELFPSKEFLSALNPKFENFVEDKLSLNYYPPTSVAGMLIEEYKELLNVEYDIPVSVSIIDAHAAVTSFPELKETGMYVSAGTSSCDIILNEKKYDVRGVAGVVKDGVLEGYYAYETGQAAVGDMFSWFVENMVPYKYYQEAESDGIHIFELLENKIRKSGKKTSLIMLDWMNGNRTPFMNTDLKAQIHGLDLSTRPEDIYLAMIESTAFGKRIIIDNYLKSGIQIDYLYFAGGLPQKNSLFNEIYSDVLGMELMISEYQDNGAVGVAVLAAYASGYFVTIEEALKSLKEHNKIVTPNKNNYEYYDEKYAQYKKLFFEYGKDEEKDIRN